MYGVRIVAGCDQGGMLRYRGRLVVTILGIVALTGCSSANKTTHTVPTTMFWVGEPSTRDNHFIPNTPSVWQNNWAAYYGGPDNPASRQGYRPATFVPKENPFYFALPYSDYAADGKVKEDVTKVPWYQSKPPPGVSIIKNQWIMVTFHGRKVYGQWEDAGPLGEDDMNYVFGSARPHYKPSGLDLSPAMADYLKLDGLGTTTWQFVAAGDVPAGPWKETVTQSQIDWTDH